ncbi:MAG: hypothetical protein E7158_06105 [Firmicutes bacterium]|nr:hypothetical protein [Bacillota bacterium]
MEGFTNFLANNYVWFLIITLILLFALIGYLVDLKDIKTGRVKKTKDDDLKIIDFSSIDQTKSLNQSIKEESSNSLNLDEYTKKSKEDEFISAESLQNMNSDSTVPKSDENLIDSILSESTTTQEQETNALEQPIEIMENIEEQSSEENK